MVTNASQRRPLIPSEPEHLPPLIVLLSVDHALGDGALQRSPVGMGLRSVRLLLVLLGIDVPSVEQLPDLLLIGGLKGQLPVGREILTPRIQRGAQDLQEQRRCGVPAPALFGGNNNRAVIVRDNHDG
jgi:hypothetical protein